MRDQIRAAIAGVFDLPVDEIPPNASPETLQAWDSLHHIELMLELELTFGVQISSEAMPELLSIDAIEEYLSQSMTRNAG